MRKVFVFFISLFLFVYIFGQSVLAINITPTQEPEKFFYFDLKEGQEIKLIFTSDTDNTFDESIGYTFFLWEQGKNVGDIGRNKAVYRTNRNSDKIKVINDKTLEVKITFQSILKKSGWWVYRIYAGTGAYEELKKKLPIYENSYYVAPCHMDTGCPTFQAYQLEFQAKQPIGFEIVDPNPKREYKIWFEGEKKFEFKPIELTPDDTSKREDGTIFIWKAEILTPEDRNRPYNICFSEGDECDFKTQQVKIIPLPVPSPNPAISINYQEESPIPDQPQEPTSIPPLPQCARWTDLQGNTISEQDAAKRKDIKCIAVDTAIGNIETDPFDFVKSILSKLLSLAGGIAVILIIIAGYRLMTSQGNPEAVQGARDQLTSAIVGFLFIIFSLVILQVIGVDILRIPGFGG